MSKVESEVEVEEIQTKTPIITPKKGAHGGRKKKQVSPADVAIIESMATDEPSLARGKPKRTIKAPKTVYEPADPRLTRKRRSSVSGENGAETIPKRARGRKAKKAETETETETETEIEEGEVVKPPASTSGEKTEAATATATATATSEKKEQVTGEKTGDAGEKKEEKDGGKMEAVTGEKTEKTTVENLEETKKEEEEEKDIKSTAESMLYEGGSNQEHMKSISGSEMIVATVTTCESDIVGGKDESLTMTTTVPVAVEEGTTTTSTSI